MPQSDELIERLRTCAELSRDGINFADTPLACEEAADRLTALQPIDGEVDRIWHALPKFGNGYATMTKEQLRSALNRDRLS